MSDQSQKPPFPEIAAIYFPVNEGGVGPKVMMSVRAKEDHAVFKEHPSEVEVWIRPPQTMPGRTSKSLHFKVHKSRIRYIEYPQVENL